MTPWTNNWTNKRNHLAVIVATILIMISPLIDANWTFLLAMLGLIVMTSFSRKQRITGSALAAVIGFVLALIIALGMHFWHR